METEQTKVSDLATEFAMRNSVVISELKKIGVWVPSPDTPVDHDIADRIRRRLQMMIELDQLEEEKAKEKKEKKKVAATKSRKTIKQLGKPRKKVEKAEEEPPTSPLSASLKPRKGKASYQKVEVPEEEVPQKTEVTIDDEPIIQRELAQVPAELLEQAMQQPTAAELGDIIDKALSQAPETRPSAEVVVPRRVHRRPKVADKAEAAPSPEKTLEPVLPEVEDVKEAVTPPGQPEPPAVEEVVVTGSEQSQQVTDVQEVTFSERITAKELAKKLSVKSSEIIKELLNQGVMASINQPLEEKIVEQICEAHGFLTKFVSFEEAAAEVEQVEERPEDLIGRAPVVTVMGHVDHGKTSVLDAIRETRVAQGEAGGITQHIGACEVEAKGRQIVFIDTPGHEAFTRMRARGAHATDLVVLVVAADDGVMPQTVEAIDHARAAEVPIVVAINKIDKPEANPERVKQALTEYQLIPEEWGGDTVMVETSATEKTNLDLLLEVVLLTADLLELKANPNRSASGVILEAKMDKGRGAVSTVLVQNGTLRVGDSFLAGTGYGKIRAMFSDRGTPVITAGPGSAAEILGLQVLPQAGDSFQVLDDPTKAREMVEYRQQQLRDKELARTSKVSLDDLYSQLDEEAVKELPLVLKADAQGSVEVVEDALEKMGTTQVQIKIIHKGVGAISESDVLLASASNAIVLGFNVRPERNAQDAADHEGVDIRLYTVIYDISEEMRKAMAGLLAPTFREVDLGRAEVRETFRVPKFGTIAGSHIEDGVIKRGAESRLLRDNVVVYEGKIDSLRRFKDDVNEVRAGYECGISIANFNDIKVGDVIEAFTREEIAPELG